MVGKIWPRIVIASAATAFTLLLLVLNVTANAPVQVMAYDLTADFSATPSSGNAPLAVQFSDIPRQGGITEWSWNFGDGDVDSGYTITHTYEKPGQYVAALTIKNGSGSQGHTTKLITVYSGGTGGHAGPSAPAEMTGSPNPGSVSIIPGTIDTPRPPAGTAVPASVTPLPTAKASGNTDMGGGLILSEDAVQLIIAGAIAVIIAAAIMFFFSNMSKRPGKKDAEKPAARAKPPARPGKSKEKGRAPGPVKKSEDISQDYIYGLVTGRGDSETERPHNKNDYMKKN